MESIGEKLRTARERNTLTIEQVARETHIAKRFLKALEEEDFSAFPGETYALGFLRGYAEYLGLDPDELVGIYRTIQIQEQPLPMTELLDTRPRGRPRRLLLAGVIVLVGVGCILGILAATGVLGGRAGGEGAAAVAAPTDFVFSDEVRTQWFSQGQGIVVSSGGKTWRVVVASIGDALTLRVPGGTVELGLGKERSLDLDGDSRYELRVVWNDVDRASSVKRVNLGLYRVSGAAADATAADAADTAIPPAATGAATAAATTPRAGAFKPAALVQASQAGLFTLDFTFRGDCLFRYLVDDGTREDRFFQKGEQFSIDTGKAQVTFWMSNAGAARLRVQGKDFELGRPGEVAARRVSWHRDASGAGYVLEIVALY